MCVQTVKPFGRVAGAFPHYANAPAWEGEGCTLPSGEVVVVGGEVLASAGMLAQGDAGPPPRAGVYRPGKGAAAARFVREATPEEMADALAAVAAQYQREEVAARKRDADEPRIEALEVAWGLLVAEWFLDNQFRWEAEFIAEKGYAPISDWTAWHNFLDRQVPPADVMLARQQLYDLAGTYYPYLRDAIRSIAERTAWMFRPAIGWTTSWATPTKP